MNDMRKGSVASKSGRSALLLGSRSERREVLQEQLLQVYRDLPKLSLTANPRAVERAMTVIFDSGLVRQGKDEDERSSVLNRIKDDVEHIFSAASESDFSARFSAQCIDWW